MNDGWDVIGDELAGGGESVKVSDGGCDVGRRPDVASVQARCIVAISVCEVVW